MNLTLGLEQRMTTVTSLAAVLLRRRAGTPLYSLLGYPSRMDICRVYRAQDSGNRTMEWLLVWIG